MKEKTVDRLPPWMARRGSNNEVLLDVGEEELKNVQKELAEVDEQTNPITADRRDTLIELGKLVREPSPTNSTDFYRRKVLVEYLKNASQGTLPQLLTATATLLDVDTSEIKYRGIKGTGGGVVDLGIPNSSLDKVNATKDEIISQLNDFSSAGYSLELFLRGGFIYKQPGYDDEAFQDDKGYAGRAADGTATRDYNGYSGIISE